MRDVVVVGGGLAGLAISGLLSKSGFSVRVVEAREKASQQASHASRSINLALSARGIRTLDALGLTNELMHTAVPMYGRQIHLADGGEDFQAYDLVGDEAIHSVRRSHLWQLLCGAAESNGADIRFDARCLNVDCDTHKIMIADSAGRTSELTYDALIGSDGAHSAVRRALVESGCVVEEIHSMRHGYLELSISRECARRLERQALHIWPRNDHMLVALPNADGSFTATLFFPIEDDPGNDLLHTRDTLLSVFCEKFPEAISLVRDLPTALVANPFGRLFTTKCQPWSNAESVLLIGDAAHTMAPFYGQGMNCALEDCCVLMRSVERFIGNWPQIFTDFERSRRLDADAITMLSEANYNEMSHHVAESEFKLRREIERALQMRFPTTFVPLYAMIAFSTLPYAEALARGVAQAGIVDRLATGLDRITDLDFETKWLKNALGRAGACPEGRARSGSSVDPVGAPEQPQIQD
jgi:kynurenine 3-monooxygenase